MNKYFLLIGVVGLVLIGGIGYRIFLRPQSSEPVITGIERIITVIAEQNEWRFTPEDIEINRGDKVIMTVINEDDYDHGIAIDAYGISQRMPAKGTIKVEFIATQEGDFPFYCSVPCGEGIVDGKKRTHFDMIGNLHVRGISNGLITQQTTMPPAVIKTFIQPTSDKIVNWKIYTDSNLNYFFQYPPPSCEVQESDGDTAFVICYLPTGSDGGLKHNNGYVISLGFISKDQLNVMGITYCGAYPNDSLRCELFKTASIDWGTGVNGNANVWIYHSNGGIITFDLKPVTTESKEILKQILSTFKFTK